MARYWIGVASREHVLSGVAAGIAQVCHGKAGPLTCMHGGDIIVYYSPTLFFMQKEPCRAFTAIGHVSAEGPYQFAMSKDFVPWRRNVQFLPCHEAPIVPLLDKLSFIKDKKKWGFPFRRGCFEIFRHDFLVIANAMGVTV